MVFNHPIETVTALWGDNLISKALLPTENWCLEFFYLLVRVTIP